MSIRKLTAATVDRIKPPPRGRVDYTDAAFPGFRLRVTERGTKSFALITRLRGKQIRVTLGRHPVLTLAKAREAARDALQAIELGVDPREAKRRAKAPATDMFAAVVQDFIKRHVRKKRLRTQVEYERPIRDYLVPRWGELRVGDITRRDIIDLVDDIADEGKPIAARRCYAIIRKFFNWAVSRGMLDYSPAVIASEDLPGRETKRDRTLSDEEIKALWPACDKLGYPFGPMLKLLLVTGQRRNEVATMRWLDADLEMGIWSLAGEVTKAGRAHIVPLSPLALEILSSLPRFDGEFVFSTTGGERPVSGFSRFKHRADELAGIENWRVHDLRRTAATEMRRLGIGRDVVGAVLNHAPRGVTAEVYDKYDLLNEKLRAFDTWGRKLESLIRPVPEKVVPIHG